MDGGAIQQPARAFVGHCPACLSVLIVQNNYETWPLIECRCGWKGDTHGVAHQAHYEIGGKVFGGRGLLRGLEARADSP